VIPLTILSAVAVLFYGIYRAAGKWGAPVLWFFAAAVSFIGAAGVPAERLWGPIWTWRAGFLKGYVVPAT